MAIIGYSTDLDKTISLESAIIRGTVINALTMLERVIDTFISSHFAGYNDKNSLELLENVFATKFITFENKRMLFQTILDTHHAEYKKLNLDNIHARLNKFNEHRNILAHCVMDIKPAAIDLFNSTKQVTFLKFEKGMSAQVYSIKQAVDISNEIFDFIKPVAVLLGFDL